MSNDVNKFMKEMLHKYGARLFLWVAHRTTETESTAVSFETPGSPTEMFLENDDPILQQEHIALLTQFSQHSSVIFSMPHSHKLSTTYPSL